MKIVTAGAIAMLGIVCAISCSDIDTEGEKESIYDKMEAVDLGLSVKWASCNLGASSPEEPGELYAWGETTTKEEYLATNYKWYDEELGRLTKYCPEDGKTELEKEDDVAFVKTKGKWRLPTGKEVDELVKKCTTVTKKANGIEGSLFVSENGASIFIPRAYIVSSTIEVKYWTSGGSIYLNYGNFHGQGDNTNRTKGHPIRPVQDYSIEELLKK